MTSPSPLTQRQRLSDALDYLVEAGVDARATPHVVDALLAGEDVIDVHCTVVADIEDDGSTELEAGLAILTPTRLLHLRPSTPHEVVRVSPDGEVMAGSLSLTNHCIIGLRHLSHVRLHLAHPRPDLTPVSADELLAQAATGHDTPAERNENWLDGVTLFASDSSAASYQVEGQTEDHDDHAHIEGHLSPFAQVQITCSVDRHGLETTMDLLRFAGHLSARAAAA